MSSDPIRYRVEAQDSTAWSFGVRMNPDKRVPEFCSLALADQFDTRYEAELLKEKAARLCGGTLRVATLRDHGGLIEVL